MGAKPRRDLEKPHMIVWTAIGLVNSKGAKNGLWRSGSSGKTIAFISHGALPKMAPWPAESWGEDAAAGPLIFRRWFREEALHCTRGYDGVMDISD